VKAKPVQDAFRSVASSAVLLGLPPSPQPEVFPRLELRLLAPVARPAQQPLEARASLLLELRAWKEQEALSALRPAQEFLS